MGPEAEAKTGQVRIVVSSDGLQAWIELPHAASPNFSPPGEADIVAALEEQEIPVTDAVSERVRQYLQIIGGESEADGGERRAEIPERFLIVEGRPPVEAQDGDFEWDQAFDRQLQDWQGDAAINYYTLNSILTIEANTAVGCIIPPIESEIGEDVFGRELTPRRTKGLPMKLGSGLRTAEDDPLHVVTEVPGHLGRKGNTIFMNEVLEIAGDVDFKSGNVDACIDVHVRGGVLSKFAVKTTKSLTIERAVEAAELDVAGDIQVRGGFFGHESGWLVRAGGSITTSICAGTNVESSADIRISKEIVNSTVRTTGHLWIEHGSIIGGEIYAREGVKVKNAGSRMGVPTRIAVGADGALLYRARRMERQIKKHGQKATYIRMRVQPLLANLKRLAPEQREQAAELTRKADEIETAAEELAAERTRVLEAAKPNGNPAVEVTGTLFSGVVLVFGLRETTIRYPIKGPVRVEERRVDGVTEVTAVNPLTASLMVLPSAMVDVKRFTKVEGKPGEPAGTAQDRRDDGDGGSGDDPR